MSQEEGFEVRFTSREIAPWGGMALLRTMLKGMKFAGAKDLEFTPASQALKWTRNLGQVFKSDTAERNGLPMSESKKRRFHPPEFKAMVALEALCAMKTVNQITQAIWSLSDAGRALEAGDPSPGQEFV
jgi:hypothetical protein